MASRRVEDLVPEIRDKFYMLQENAKKDGIEFLITCTYRSLEEQEALYAQGREAINVVNELRKKAGLLPISEKENKIVTYAKAKESKHNYGKAFDIAVLESGKLVWDVTHPVWRRIGELGEKAGLIWAGRWKKFKEYPHFEI